ncbi:MAG: DUF6090 family protein [Ferruginibacter sp.]
MAEQEVIKHTKKVYNVWKGPTSFWHKFKEFLLEIFIIVFAISLSLWFHNRSEHSHRQDEVKKFLRGLKKDLTADIVEMEEDKGSYFKQRNAFMYINSVKPGQLISTDSLKLHYRYIMNSTALNPNNGRFEGFKSAGKIGDIENDSLQNDIMDLYQENIPSLLSSTNGYVNRKIKLFEYIQQNNKRLTDSTSNFAEVLNTEQAHNICGMLTFTGEITERYELALQRMKRIIAMINKEYMLTD